MPSQFWVACGQQEPPPAWGPSVGCLPSAVVGRPLDRVAGISGTHHASDTAKHTAFSLKLFPVVLKSKWKSWESEARLQIYFDLEAGKKKKKEKQEKHVAGSPDTKHDLKTKGVFAQSSLTVWKLALHILQLSPDNKPDFLLVSQDFTQKIIYW